MTSPLRVEKLSANNTDFHHQILPIILFAIALNLLPVANAQTAPALSFVSVAPCRIVDTREPDGSFGGPSLAAGGTRSFVIPSSSCNIPAGALAFALNITVVPHKDLGYLTVWPTGQSQPYVSTLNSMDGRIKANAAIMPAGSGGAISVYATDATDVIIDINGYFANNSSTSALAFFALPPCRVADTRNPNGPLAGPYLTGGQERDLPILSSSCGIPSTAQAYSLNFTAVPHAALNYLTVWPTGTSRPWVSTLNAGTGAITANAAITPAGANGEISVYSTDNTDLVVDVNGYFAPASSASEPLWLYNVAPCRVLDTRTTGATLPLSVEVAGNCAVPAAAGAFVTNATVIPQGQLSYLTIWPDGMAQPMVSTLNAMDGVVASNMAIVPSSNGSINAASKGTTALVLDINGYFAQANAPDTLTVQIPNSTSTTGPGYVSSSPAGISCGWEIVGGSGIHGIACSYTYSAGTSVTLTATPMSGYVFGSWSGGCNGTSSTCTLTMNDPATVTATFTTQPSQTITITPADINWLELSPVDSRQNTAFPAESSLAVGQTFGNLSYTTGCPTFIAYASVASFNTSSIKGKTIDSATLNLTAYPMTGYGSYMSNFEIAVVASSWSSSTVTWTSVLINSPGLQLYNDGWAGSGPEWMVGGYPTSTGEKYSADVTYVVQHWANGSFASDGLFFRSTNYWNCPSTVDENDAYTINPSVTVNYH